MFGNLKDGEMEENILMEQNKETTGSTSARTVGKRVGLILLIIAVVVITLVAIPLIQQLSDPEVSAQFKGWVEQLGFGGWLLFLGIQIAQIVLAFIPGEPVELAAGLIYGTWNGFFTCLLGVEIGSLLVFFAVKRFGMPLVTRFFSEEKLKSYRFLQNAERLELITFILFFIPGTPKDILTYVAALSPIKPARFLFISGLARIPSILSSTVVGAQLSQGNLWNAALIYAVVGVVGIGGILVHNKLMARWGSKDSDHIEDDKNSDSDDTSLV